MNSDFNQNYQNLVNEWAEYKLLVNTLLELELIASDNEDALFLLYDLRERQENMLAHAVQMSEVVKQKILGFEFYSTVMIQLFIVTEF